LFWSSTEQAVYGPLDKTQEVNATIEDCRHVRTEVAPRETQRDDQGENREEEAHLELLRLEHGVTQVEEHHDCHDEQDDLAETHTRSSAQMRPSITAVKAMKPTAE
jgi:hypothetical protein